MQHVKLSDERKEAVISGLQHLFANDFEEDLSSFRADKILDYFLVSLGSSAYNQGVQDARSFIMDKLEDLVGDIHEVEG